MTQRSRAGSGPSQRRSARGPARPLPTQPRADLAAQRARLRDVIEPVVADAGYDLEDLSLSRVGRRHLVRVLVDADGGVDLDGVAVVSRAVSAALDAAEESGDELFPGEYQLEVGSPGVDRPLRLPRHWRRNVGRLVQVTAAGRLVTARIIAADDAGVVLEVAGTATEFGYGDLGPGTVQVEFARLAEADLDDDELDDDEDVEDEER